MMNRLTGNQADWKEVWNMFPEFCLLLGMVCVGNVICGCIKIKQIVKYYIDFLWDLII